MPPLLPIEPWHLLLLPYRQICTVLTRRKLLVGNPAKIVKDVSDEMIQWKTKGTRLYQQLPGDLHKTLKECEPLREEPENRPSQSANYETWGKE